MLKLNVNVTSSNGGTSLTHDTVADTGAILPRANLYQRIGIPPKLPITIVIAPAGYGKSTVVTQWAKQQQHPVAWVSLTRGTNSIAAMTMVIARAVANCVHDEDPAALSSMDELVARLHNVTTDRGPITLVFDDYHLIENRDVHDAMNALLLLRPARLSIVFLSRHELPLALGRLRAEGLIQQFTAQGLAFTPDEVADVANRVAGTALDSTQAALLADRTEGWIAGIRLALASLQQTDPASITSILDRWAAHRWLDDYVVEEVLAPLRPELRTFVLRTSNLPYLDADLCNHVLGIGTSAALLEEVSRRMIFVRPYGTDGKALTWHALFAESTKRIAERLEDADIRRARLERAAIWFSGHGQLGFAIECAIAAEAWDHAPDLVRKLCRPLTLMDSQQPRLHWLSKLPQALLLADSELTHWYLSALRNTGQLREARQIFAQVAPVWQASQDPSVRAHVAAHLRFTAALEGDIGTALRLAYDSLTLYSLEHAVERLHAWTVVMQIEFQNGNDFQVGQAYRQAAACRESLPAEQWWWSMVVELDHANHQALRGHLGRAADLYRDGMSRLPPGLRDNVGRFRFRLAAIALEQNNLEEANRECVALLRDLDRTPYHLWHPEALMVVAQVQDASGDLPAMEATLRRVRTMYEQHGGRHNLNRLEALEVSLWLRTGRLGLVQSWLSRARMSDYSGVRIFGDGDPRLAMVRARLALGDVAGAERDLLPLIDEARTRKRWAELVPMLVWHLICQMEAGDIRGARDTLRTALQHGRRGSFVRAFLPTGYELEPFLRRSIRYLNTADADYVRHLTGDTGSDRRRTSRPPITAPAPQRDGRPALSAREQDVLELLRLGKSNVEIAQRLFISEPTAKKHVGNILAKLGVKNRVEAAMWATRNAAD